VNPADVAPMVVVSIMFVMGGLTFILRGPIGKANARRFEGGGGLPPTDTDTRLQELESRVADLELERHELTERVDFAERLLTQLKDAPKELHR
jgi:hypothetical protein